MKLGDFSQNLSKLIKISVSFVRFQSLFFLNSIFLGKKRNLLEFELSYNINVSFLLVLFFTPVVVNISFIMLLWPQI